MIIPSLYFSFLLASIVIELTPGPNMGYLAAISSLRGHKAGFSMVAGIALGLLIMGLICSTGAATIIMDYPVIYETMRWAGVLYMLWLAYDGWRGKINESSLDGDHSRYFLRGLITNLLNPKAAMFYLTVMPSFLDAASPPLPQALTLTFSYVAIATAAHSLIALLSNKAGSYINRDGSSITLIRYGFAILMVLIAIWLAWHTARPA